MGRLPRRERDFRILLFHFRKGFLGDTLRRAMALSRETSRTDFFSSAFWGEFPEGDTRHPGVEEPALSRDRSLRRDGRSRNEGGRAQRVLKRQVFNETPRRRPSSGKSGSLLLGFPGIEPPIRWEDSSHSADDRFRHDCS